MRFLSHIFISNLRYFAVFLKLQELDTSIIFHATAGKFHSDKILEQNYEKIE